MRRRSVALAGPPKSAKNRGVRLFKTVRLIGRIWYAKRKRRPILEEMGTVN